MTSLLREWAPLTDLFARLPAKEKTGLLSVQDVELTCVDALPRYLALGTNLGLVYWFDRDNRRLQRLQCEHSRESVTCVKVVSTVDNMVACGTADGHVNIFQIAVDHPDTIPENMRPKKSVPHRYLVSDLHTGTISALEWSRNGMKLFSGDRNGTVVLTEFDFSMRISFSKIIINESYEIVQLGCQASYLLVCTMYRSIICKHEDGRWKVVQMGQKDRKTLDVFGGVIRQRGPNPRDVEVFCVRPGLRIWRAGVDGVVQHTILFKELLKSPCAEIALINPASEEFLRVAYPTSSSASFGPLIPFGDDYVTYGKDVLYVLSFKDECIKCRSTKLRRILDVSVTKEEIFVLEGKRSLIRLSESGERITNGVSPSKSSITGPARLPQSMSASYHPDTSTNVEEATEACPPVLELEQQRRLNIYAQISNLDFDDDILYRPVKTTRRRRPTRARSGTITSTASSISSASSSEDHYRDVFISQPPTSSGKFLPDLRSQDEIARDIENKELLLADVLCFEDLEKFRQRMRRRVVLEESPKAVVTSAVPPPAPIIASVSMDRQVLNSALNVGEPLSPTVPICRDIPRDWNLKKIEVDRPTINNIVPVVVRHERRVTERSEDLSDDWEVI